MLWSLSSMRECNGCCAARRTRSTAKSGDYSAALSGADTAAGGRTASQLGGTSTMSVPDETPSQMDAEGAQTQSQMSAIEGGLASSAAEDTATSGQPFGITAADLPVATGGDAAALPTGPGAPPQV